MKKSLLALAVLGAFAGVASAQSSVTLFGVVDLNARYVKNDGSNRRLSLSQDGINSSRIGFRGTEDLGGGLKAGFWLEGGLSADTGNSGISSDSAGKASGKFFGRRSTVSLMGGFGEVRLGRDYTPSFWNQTIFDAFGTVGLGDSSGILQMVAPDFARADNTIGYFLPSGIGGLYGQAMVAAGEATAAGRYVGGRIGFAAGPFDVAAAYAEETLAAGKYKTANVGGSYDLGVAKLMGYYNEDKLSSAKEKRLSVSVVVPIGQGEIHVGGQQSKFTDTGVSNKVSKYAVGYVYNLSKRTALYSNVARMSNGNLSQLSLGSVGSSATAAPTLGGKSTGAEFGVRHIF